MSSISICCFAASRFRRIPGLGDPREAADVALQLPYDAFRDQVLPFLEPDAVELYDSEPAWEQMQTFVAEKLEEAK